MAVSMSLGGVSLGPNFPVYGRDFELIRLDEQGPSFKKIKIVLQGFLEGNDHAAVMALYNTLKTNFVKNDTTFTYTDGATTICNNQKVYIAGLHEPGDVEFAKYHTGDYGIELYYFESAEQNLGITCQYNAYVFQTVPKWGRKISDSRESHRGKEIGSTATISLSGFLFHQTHTALMAEILALQNALLVDGLLTYGVFQQQVKRVSCDVAEVVPMNYAYYSIELRYDIGEIIALRRGMSISRIHQHPVISEEPGCNRRVIEFMNRSGQSITYTFSIEAEQLATARSLLATEVVNAMEPGGIEMPGGTENWDLDAVRVDVNFTKFYNQPVLGNLPGTGE